MLGIVTAAEPAVFFPVKIAAPANRTPEIEIRVS
jgi:hypothetical protein